MNFEPRLRRTWAVVDLGAAEHNYKMLDGTICCVVKANAYGHGAIQLSRLYESLGAEYLAVSNINEALQLRKAGIKTNILILGYTPPCCAQLLAENKIDQTIYNMEYACALNNECVDKKVFVKTHIKIDTGMGRIGFQVREGIDELPFALQACNLSNLEVVGIFTHFSSADDSSSDWTLKQFGFFKRACQFIENNGIHIKYKHCCNSAGILSYPNMAFDMVRPGIILYGISDKLLNNCSFVPVLSLYSVVTNVKKVSKGECISYGRSYVCDSDKQIATISIGYADGFWRSNTGSRVFINGKYCKIVGKICMDQLMVECEDAKIGDVVEIIGIHISVEEVATFNKTIPYEILCSIGERVPRVYVKNDQVVEVDDRLV